MKRTFIKTILKADYSPCAKTPVCVKGWVRTKRDSKGGFSFVELNDGTCLKNLQLIIDQDLANYANDVLPLKTGASISAEGLMVTSGGKGQSVEMQVTSLICYGNTDDSYPIQKGRISLETLRSHLHLRPRTNTISAVTRLRNRLTHSVHQFFQDRSFNYINTPLITGSDCEGAGSLFQVTTLPLDKIPHQQDNAKAVDYSKDFFSRPAHLTVSGQLEGEAYALALGQIYTFGPTFRAENSNTTRHLAEFWMVEPEVAFHDIHDNMDLAEDLLKYVVNDAIEHCAEDLDFFAKRINPDLRKNLAAITDNDFARLSYTQAVEILQNGKANFEFPVQWGIDLQSEHERYLSETHFKKPVILTDYPADIKPFYMYLNDKDSEGRQTVRGMDVLVPGIGEIIGGAQREDRLDVLEARMIEAGLDLETYSWYLDLRRYGSTPHAGFGLGFERLAQYVSGMANIRDVIAYPRTPGHL